MNHPARFKTLLVAALLCLTCASSVRGQTAGADYTNDLPSVERVKAEIKGSDATDTLARQVAVFTYLQAYIDRIKYNRTVRGEFTPGEVRAKTAYSLAAYQMSQEYAKTHTPEQAAAFERLHGNYEMDQAFRKDWTARLIGPQSATALKDANAGLAAAGQRRYDQAMADYKRDSAAQQAADKQMNAAQGGLSNDPTAVATRRCLELGGTAVACMGKGLMSGFMDMVGFGDKVQEELKGPGRAGVVLNGRYKSPAATAILDFGEDNVSIEGCGRLVADPHSYAIDKRPGSVRITVDNEPSPILLTMRPDGGLTGPGAIDVKGRIIIGYHTVTHTLYRDGVPAAPGTCNGPCTTTESVPDYAPKIERCVIGSLAMPPAPKPAPATAANDNSLMGTVTGLMSTIAPGAVGPVGLRMTGKFGGGTLLLDFSGNSLVLDCGQAHVRQPYTVENTPSAFLVHVQNSGGPFTLALQPDNSLRGSGSTAVNGRLVTGMNGDNVAFTPHSETCEVAAFHPKTGATATTAVAAASPAPAPAAAVPVSSTGIVNDAGMKLAISSSFPGAANPLAGKPFTLMTERFDILLRKFGVPIPANATPGDAAKGYAANCAPPRSCPALVASMRPYYVGKGTFDSTGKATLAVPIPAGTYYVFCSAVGPNGPLLWDVPTTLKAGDNVVTLTSTNAELMH